MAILALKMEKPETLAVATSPYEVSCETSYLDTMSLPDLTLYLNGKVVPSVTSQISGLFKYFSAISYELSKTCLPSQYNLAPVMLFIYQLLC
jgi:hypothetical protein